MTFQVSGKEYLDLLALKRTVEAVLKTYHDQCKFIGTPGCDALARALQTSLNTCAKSAVIPGEEAEDETVG